MKLSNISRALLLCLLLPLLAACNGRPQEPTVTDEPTAEGEAQPPTPETEDLTDYAALVAHPFAELAEAPEGEFSVTDADGGVTVTGYLGSSTELRLPAVIGGKPVVGIGDNAFSDQTELTVLWLPDSITVFGKNILVGCSKLYALRTPLPQGEGQGFIGYLYGAEIYQKNNMPELRNLDFLELGGALAELPAYALYDCNDLVCLKLPQSVKSLGEFSLYSCTSLKYLNAEGLQSIGRHAMDGCAEMTDLIFGDSLTEIGLGALENCRSLRNLTLPFVGGSREEDQYLGYLFGATDPSFSGGFYPAALRSVKLTEGCTELGRYAFYECESLWTVELPASLSEIGVRAFSGCTGLRSLSMPGVQRITDNAFVGCTALGEVTFAEGLIAIGVNAFSGCTALEKVTLPQTLKALPNSCFYQCRALREIDLGGVESVGTNAFLGCDAVASVTAAGNVKLSEGNEKLRELLP